MIDNSKLKKFAQFARTNLTNQVKTKLEYVLSSDTAELRENTKALNDLKRKIEETSESAVIERVAYIWFNRFCALRFMDVNGYSKIGIVSPAEGATQPEILATAKQGYIDDRIMPKDKADIVQNILAGKISSKEPQTEAYKMLLVSACNYYHQAMPFLFEKIEDYTELLMPDDLLSNNSILAYVRESLTPKACEDVEVIGWLYQYYISEKKDEVFEGLKKNKKITPENIPAATQLFTPHWIVRYLAENSIGRLWLLNHPKSKLADKMEYYIKPERVETDFIKISKPEEIKICDPACGSGHMLTYAFDLLYAVYEEEGYNEAEIPSLILQNNLYGIEIDERAGSLASFALTMKAREKNKRFLEKNIQPNICVLENIKLSDDEKRAVKEELGSDLLTGNFNLVLSQFEEADNFGSLIRPADVDIMAIKQTLKAQKGNSKLFFDTALDKMNKALTQADYLKQKYHVVIANPPYMGGKGMNSRMSTWVKENYKDSKSDLFAMFIERNLDLAIKQGMTAMITMQSWMFLSSFEALRKIITEKNTILSMAHLGARAFDSIGGEVVSTTAFVLGKEHKPDYKGAFIRLVDGNSEAEKAKSIKEAIKDPNCGWFHRASASDFSKIPGSPIAYWAKKEIFKSFEKEKILADSFMPRQGLATTDNARFVRLWFEVKISSIGFNLVSTTEAQDTMLKWFPMDKGGNYRKWYGNNSSIVNWKNDGAEIKENIIKKYPYLKGNPDFVAKNSNSYFKAGTTWGKISSAKFSCRFTSIGFIFSDAGSKIPTENNLDAINLTLFLNTPVASYCLSLLSQTLNFEQGTIAKIPFNSKINNQNTGDKIISLSKSDWDSYETSWDFTDLPILRSDFRENTFEQTYAKLRSHWQGMTDEMKKLEEENNRIFIDAYGLNDELTPDVPLEEITLTCNPYYRYDAKKSKEELDTRLLEDTCQEFIHYAVGCMFGRYSLDKEGLILANQGETLEDYLEQIPNPSFAPDKDNIIPILDESWFSDDIVERFSEFLKLTFGQENYRENLAFIENAIGKSLRKYFTKDFYNYHIRRYKKRPIYWQFSSPKGSFNALIYMHRYRPDTVSILLNNYLRDFVSKLEAKKESLVQIQISANSSDAEKNKAIKEIEKLKTMIDELNTWEKDVIFPLAGERLEIDLDDGVKVNYLKFGKALKEIKGLESKED